MILFEIAMCGLLAAACLVIAVILNAPLRNTATRWWQQ